MKKIDESRLETDLEYRFQYLAEFMGFVADAVNATILTQSIPDSLKAAAIRAFAKLLWIQNDLISRHYVNGN